MIMLERMDTFFENRLTDYDEHMLTAIEGAEEFYRFTAQQLPPEGGAKVLDLGCGTGLELERYFSINPNARVTGIDLSAGMLKALAAKLKGRDIALICGSYFDAELGEECFDAAVSVESLHHFPDFQKLALYKKLCVSLKQGGYFILTDYFAESDEEESENFAVLDRLKREQGINDNEFYHYDTPLTAAHETELLKKAGFSKVRVLKSWGATYTLRAEK